jgi:hypothetical protein
MEDPTKWTKCDHAANVLLQYLDSDEDGTPNDKKLTDKMAELKSTMWIGKDINEAPKILEAGKGNGASWKS